MKAFENLCPLLCSFLRHLARDESRREYFTRFSRIPVKKLSVYDNKDCCNGLYMYESGLILIHSIYIIVLASPQLSFLYVLLF